MQLELTFRAKVRNRDNLIRAVQRLAQQLLAHRVAPGRVNIIDPRVDCAPHHFYRRLLVLRQAHHAESQRRKPDARISEISVYHRSASLF